MEQKDLLLAVLVLLTAAVIAVPLFKRLGLGSVLGYLVAGAVVGPWGLGITSDVEAIRHFAEFGVVFLLFIVGLELHPSKLWVMRRAVFGMGTLQVVLTGGSIGVYAWFFGVPWSTAVVVGFGLALSSTAIGLQILTERGEVGSDHGRAAFAILLMQDMAVVPLLALVPLMAEAPVAAGESFGIVALKDVAALAAVVVIVRFVLRPGLRVIAIGRNTEAFAGAAVLAVLGAAWLMEQVHLSMALGAFLTGLLLSDSEYRHQIEADVQPFRGFLLGLFFMAVGMSLNFGLMDQVGLRVVGHVAGVMVIKSLVLFGLCLAFRHSRESATRVALLLPQCGEFGFVLFGVAFASGVITDFQFQFLLLLIAVSMATTPVLANVADWLVRRMEGSKAADTPEGIPEEIKNHVVIAGFGRGGKMVALMLKKNDVPYVALDLDPDKVATGLARGYHVFYGDATRAEVLQTTGAGRAKLAVVTLDNPAAVERTIAAIRYLYPGLPIEARAHDLKHSEKLIKMGATGTIPEAIEATLQLGRAVLFHVGVEEDRVTDIVENIRHDDYALIRKIVLDPAASGSTGK
ncbi:MAG: monovalent cation:proton antiporter-2 (CPA2) family protein [Nitrospiraceae bacterium]